MGVTISSGNSPYDVSSGQVDTNDVVVSGGSMFVLSGGTAIGTTLLGHGQEVVSGGGEDDGALISGGFQDLEAAGTASGTADITASGATVVGGGVQFVGYERGLGGTTYLGSAIAISTTVGSGGTQVLSYFAGDQFRSRLIGSGSAISIDTTVESGGTQIVGDIYYDNPSEMGPSIAATQQSKQAANK
jgi:autotransporter passenger strand-loop-strand repeat protein